MFVIYPVTYLYTVVTVKKFGNNPITRYTWEFESLVGCFFLLAIQGKKFCDSSYHFALVNKSVIEISILLVKQYAIHFYYYITRLSGENAVIESSWL